MTKFRTLEWTGDALRLLDQRRLPAETIYLELRDAPAVAEAIRAMVVRGAPAIGAAAAYGLALAALNAPAERLLDALEQAAEVLRRSRPTAVNLFWAINRVMAKVRANGTLTADALRALVINEAHAIAEEDVMVNKAIAQHGQSLVPDGATIIHHCNTGSLATVDYGTALGVIRYAHEIGKRIHVYLDETRPRLQGAKLSAWELNQLGVPHTVIVDGASGFVMQRHKVDLCIVGADRIAANGDTANKIGTYNLALVAKAHGVPFYVAAPTSSVDLSIRSGAEIPIEERSADEVACVGATRIVPEGSPVLNYAFDVTPAHLITAIITEVGVIYPPYEEGLARAVHSRAEAR
jgi:methylthioribose-1-phosphate isomerase